MSFTGNNGRYSELQKRLGITFAKRDLLVTALTHRSVLAEVEGAMPNERLEFLGDTVLDLIIAEELYKAHPEWPEGELTKAKAAAVGERSLEQVARNWNLGPYIRISRGEESSGGRERRALLADTVEAIIGAYYLDHGLEACRAFVLREMMEIIESVERQEHQFDCKTQLQEVFQARYQAAPTYEIVGKSGPPHDRTFEVTVSFNDQVLGYGKGKSKKEAEQQAADQALHSPIVTQ